MKNLKTIFFAGAIILSMASCDSLDTLNEDEKSYTTTLPSALMTSAQVNYAYFLTNASVNDNNFRGYAQHWTTTTYTDEVNYNQVKRNLGNSHSILLYRDVLQDLINAQKMVQDKEALGSVEVAVKKNNIAILEVQIIMAYQALVDLFGNVVYTEALDIDAYPYPKYDDAKTIYFDLADRLNTAISDMDVNNESFGQADLVYAGNVAKWRTLANSVKLKMGLHLADVEFEKSRTMVESAVNSGVMSNESETALFQYFTSITDMNPLYDNLVNESQIVPTAFFVNILNANEDPRRDVFFNPESKKGGEYVGAAYAQQVSYGDYSNMGERLKEKSNPGVLFDYTETCFLLADAANRGFEVGGTPEEYYTKGIEASMSFWGVADADTQIYLNRSDVAFSTAPGTSKEKIANQLWIAYFNRGFEAWTEYRRLDFPVLKAPVTAVEEAKGKVPVRNIYSIFDKTLNGDNYEAASNAIGGDLMTTKIFWDKF
ncbi:SusD/RagB family nutrient-binding outer membrane lipoprotein [Gelidibacter maritimus]|uniref:SusD/RagB family nutrient-binding outer membrane lipoprotein n=1 Tax=Gelidibacter maritimus TaxID=2761487 RepID=A0A7W2R5C3_9FLAO|nr:SusD/RagB family nutrient-binding outer membrane lipoprotein [Gelidibacter maritimus]MBA6154781.1 SusD/RagB family nutrient-binding outer membrane lipoprotein [Gelidibacter maritimus]